jgi:hypothetical protein
MPLDVGKLPTMTHPERRTARAVVRPMPPGQGPGKELRAANTLSVPFGAISTMVVPVPCALPLLLKLLTKICPATSLPVVTGTIATPYGFMSPFGGTVGPIVLIFERLPRSPLAAESDKVWDRSTTATDK